MRITLPRLGGIVGLALLWAQSYQVATLDPKQPASPGGKIAAVLLPAWYSAFKVSQLTPCNKPENTVWHTLGKVIFPLEYTSFQLSQMKSSNTGLGEKLLGIILGPIYSIFAATQIKEAKRVNTPIPSTTIKPAIPQQLPVAYPSSYTYPPAYPQSAVSAYSNMYRRPLSV